MEIVLLDANTLGKDTNLNVFKNYGDLTIYPTTSPKEVDKRVQNATIIITNKVVINRQTMDNSPNLKLICIAATGLNNVDLEYAKQKGIAVKNVAGYSTKSVAQYTLMQVLSLIGHNHHYNHYVQSGEWVKSPIFVNIDKPFYELEGKRWGIIGLGNIGQEVAKLASSFGCDVCYYSSSGKNKNKTYKQLTLKELLKTSQIITVHAPLNEQTNNLISQKELALMQQDAIILNAARGGIINEEALVEAINNEKIYAAVDVLVSEPMSKDSPYLHVKKEERILLSPHLAWASIEARQRLIAGVCKNIEDFLKQ